MPTDIDVSRVAKILVVGVILLFGTYFGVLYLITSH